jgi:hypothetical protein
VSVVVLIALAVVMALVMALAILQLFRRAWRILRGDEEMEAGGSWGRQLFGRRKENAP